MPINFTSKGFVIFHLSQLLHTWWCILRMAFFGVPTCFLCVLLLASGVWLLTASEASESRLIWLNFLKLMFDPRSIIGLDGGWIEFRGMSFSLYLSIFDKDPVDDCKYEVGRFFKACFWYIFPGDAAIVELLLPKLSWTPRKDCFRHAAWAVSREPSYFFLLRGVAKAVRIRMARVLKQHFIDISAASCKYRALLIRLPPTGVSLFTVTDK